MNELVKFAFEGKQVRITDRNGEPWWVSKDVAEALGYEWKGMSGTMPHVPMEWTGSECFRVRSENGVEQDRELGIISEQGLYFFLGRSDKPLALPFQKWIAGAVIPSIRKTGSYTAPGAGTEPPAVAMMRACQIAYEAKALTAPEWRRLILGILPEPPRAKPWREQVQEADAFIAKHFVFTNYRPDWVKAIDVYRQYRKEIQAPLPKYSFSERMYKAGAVKSNRCNVETFDCVKYRDS